jgi:hypothetical protein
MGRGVAPSLPLPRRAAARKPVGSGGIVILGQDPDAWVDRVDALLDADEAAERGAA